jgi:signal transduction histidine kinase
METFALAAISLTISTSLFIKKKKSSVHLSFAFLCLALFFQKAGEFFYGILDTNLWKSTDYIGLLFIPSLLMVFFRLFLDRQKSYSNNVIILTALGGFLLATLCLTPLYEWPHLNVIFYFYVGFTLVYCYAVLVDSVKTKKNEDPDKKKFLYLAIACTLAAALSISDIFYYYGYKIPPMSNIAMAVLIYFTLIIITHPRLPEIHEIMCRALIILALVLFVTIIFYIVINLFGKNIMFPSNSILMASFIIVISIDPAKLILKKIASRFFFEGKNVFLSLYAIDEEVEKEKSMFLEEMATGLAHEIRNPLSSIKGAAQYLKSEAGPTQDQRLLDVIVEETDRLNGVVSQFLDYARPDSINAELQDVNRIIDKVISLIKTAGKSEDINIERHLDGNLPYAKIDGEQMIQVILNVALNAIESMPEGGTLSFSTGSVDNGGGKTIEIVVRDTGCGIEKDDLKNIFKPFFTTKKRGTGLGLPVCRKIVKKHGGHIDVESVPGQGTAVFIRI